MPEAHAAHYHRPLELDLERIQELCSERVFRQAQRYAESAHMTDRMRVGAKLSAKFHGTRGIYTTRLDLSSGELDYKCECPLAGGREPCKHAIAVGLSWVQEPEDFHDLDVTLARLAHAPKAELLTLLRQIANRVPELVVLLDKSSV